MIPARLGASGSADNDTSEAQQRARMSAYFNNRRETHPETMQTAHEGTAIAEAIGAAIKRGERILLAGGPGGSYGEKIERDKRFEHLKSTEPSNRDRNYILPRGIGCVLISNHISVMLTKAIVQQCEHRKIKVFGTFRSCGSITRAVEVALALVPSPPKPPVAPQRPLPATNGTHHHNGTNGHGMPSDDALEQEEAAATAQLAEVDRKVTTPPAPAHVPAPPNPIAAAALGLRAMPPGAAALTKDPLDDDQQVKALRYLFGELRAALDLAEQSAVDAIKQARKANASADAVEKLAALQKTLKTLGISA